MATTRIIPMHLNKGKSIKQCISERLDYGKNPDKTENELSSPAMPATRIPPTQILLFLSVSIFSLPDESRTAM